MVFRFWKLEIALIFNFFLISSDKKFKLHTVAQTFLLSNFGHDYRDFYRFKFFFFNYFTRTHFKCVEETQKSRKTSLVVIAFKATFQSLSF